MLEVRSNIEKTTATTLVNAILAVEIKLVYGKGGIRNDWVGPRFCYAYNIRRPLKSNGSKLGHLIYNRPSIKHYDI